ncbi:glycoside hydrolase family 3 protein [Erwinia sp. 198]|uniref:glycoside hydrolase family 3 protein n=1 Tax=Erwinia sp. 198 TaxID=2022746 RepID=UPI000F65CB37|nr:glycoside hydrolase family 3 N-terminal domain-containing protein [Erwinia sp. 198]RRZ88504.1 glycoside hydrolase family 3 protein [Erwinia sp. 198]
MKNRLIAQAIAVSLLFPFAAYAVNQPALGKREVKMIAHQGLIFKDLNKDGTLNPYEDWRLSPRQRAADLLSRMTLKEKAGVMMHGSAPAPGSVIGQGQTYDIASVTGMIVEQKVNTFITRLNTTPAAMAEQNNRLQAIAESTRLGIPITLSTDPRSVYSYPSATGSDHDGFSKWPGPLGIAAIGDENLTRRYADIVRQEYRLLGITQALSPMADIATEPRWSRIAGTFGDDPQLTRRMVRGYITGMQHGARGLNAASVSAIVKHWVGYGAAEKGYDSHHSYGKYADFTGRRLDDHLLPFTGAFEARVAGVMPTYSILKNLQYQGRNVEPVAAGFNRYLLQDLLRQAYRFEGVIVSDWLIANDCKEKCLYGYPPGETPDPGSLGMPWGVEDMSTADRFALAVNAGIDQFGGVADSALLIQAVKTGRVSQSRLDQSVIRILEQKFALGLFENPYVDPTEAAKTLAARAWQTEADSAQRASLVLLEKKAPLLPLRKGLKVWLYGINPEAARQAGFAVMDNPESADVALMRIVAPYEQPHKNYFFGAQYHEGSLAFTADNRDRQAVQRASKIPTIITVYLDRPAILTPIKEKASILIGNFGVSDEILFRALTDGRPFSGSLPFEIPSSEESVLKQHPASPHDSVSPLYPTGFGLH